MGDWSIGMRLKARVQALVRRRVWHIDIGEGTRIHPTAYVDRTWPKGIHIGARCTIDADAVILSHDMTRGLYLDTRIGAGSRIGTRAIVMPGITIGADCVVLPGAVVTRDVAAGAVVAGNPAQPCAPAAVEPGL